MEVKQLIKSFKNMSLTSQQETQNLNKELNEILKLEEQIRECTIKVEHGNEPDSVLMTIETGLMRSLEEFMIKSDWQDKKFIYIQFMGQEDKDKYLKWTSFNNKPLEQKTSSLHGKENDEEIIVKKPIRIVMENVPKNLKSKRVKSTLRDILKDENSIVYFHEKNENNNTRDIHFSTDSNGYRKLFLILNGEILIANEETGISSKLYLKINCRAVVCSKCFAFGKHTCGEKTCYKCGSKKHRNYECESKTKTCMHCGDIRHNTMDSNCYVLIKETIEELRKLTIPMEHFVNRNLRFSLLEHVIGL